MNNSSSPPVINAQYWTVKNLPDGTSELRFTPSGRFNLILCENVFQGRARTYSKGFGYLVCFFLFFGGSLTAILLTSLGVLAPADSALRKAILYAGLLVFVGLTLFTYVAGTQVRFLFHPDRMTIERETFGVQQTYTVFAPATFYFRKTRREVVLTVEDEYSTTELARYNKITGESDWHATIIEELGVRLATQSGWPFER